MRRVRTILLIPAILCGVAFAQGNTQSPSAVAIKFYRALKDKHYVEGFKHSVYRGAVEGLTGGELKELEPEFARTFSSIPDKIEARGENITGDNAVVTLKFDGIEELQQVSLVKVRGGWLVGDPDSLKMVEEQGKAFFFNTRIIVNEGEAFMMLSRMISAEIIYSQKFEGRHASLQELIRLGGVPGDLAGGESNGYRYSLMVSADLKSFYATATPLQYGKTGRLSFYADANGVRAEDVKGGSASATSPVYRLN